MHFAINQRNWKNSCKYFSQKLMVSLGLAEFEYLFYASIQIACICLNLHHHHVLEPNSLWHTEQMTSVQHRMQFTAK